MKITIISQVRPAYRLIIADANDCKNNYQNSQELIRAKQDKTIPRYEEFQVSGLPLSRDLDFLHARCRPGGKGGECRLVSITPAMSG